MTRCLRQRALPQAFFSALALLLASSSAESISATKWGVQTNGLNRDYIRGLDVDADGNTYVAGYYKDTTDLGGAVFTASNEMFHGFVAKYDPAGAHLWSFAYDGTGEDLCWAITVDPAGEITVCGSFTGSVSLGGAVLTNPLTQRHGFLAKYDSDGNHLWSQSMGGTGTTEPSDVAASSSGQLAVSGSFVGELDLGDGLHVSAGSRDFFVAKYDEDGNLLWSQAAGGTGNDFPRPCTFDPAGSVIASGLFENTIDFGDGPHTSAGGRDIFIVKYDGSGNLAWSQRAGGILDDWPNGLATGGQNRVYLVGMYEETITFGPASHTSVGNRDGFILKVRPTGAYLWSDSFGGAGDDALYDVDFNGPTVAVSGTFNGSATIGGVPLTSAGGTDAIVAWYEQVPGTFVGVETAGGTGSDVPVKIAHPTPDDVVIAGNFQQPATFGSITLPGFDDIEGFVVSYGSATVGTPAISSPWGVGQLAAPRPNPMTSSTVVGYSLPVTGGEAMLEVLDVSGRRVRSLASGRLPGGAGAIVWDGRDDAGRRVAAGSYFVRLAGEGFSSARRLTLLR